MKDSEFIELLNLYLDHEISAEDAARIEAEVQQNPARRQLYRQYCRLQKACTMLAKDYVGQAESTGSPADRRIVAFAPQRSWGASVYVGGLAVAAACVALFVVNRSQEEVAPALAASSLAVQQPASVPAAQGQLASVDQGMTQVIAHAVTVPASRAELQPVFSARALVLRKDDPAADAGLAAANTVMLRNQFNWMKSIELSPIQRMTVDDLRFDTKADQKINPRVYGPGRIQDDAKQAAFQFQR